MIVISSVWMVRVWKVFYRLEWGLFDSIAQWICVYGCLFHVLLAALI